MALSNLPFFPVALRSDIKKLLAADSTNPANVIIGGTNGTKIEAIQVTSNDNIDHALTISLNVAGTLCNIANVNIPANCGSNVISSLPINLLSNTSLAFLPQDMNGNKYLYLANSTVSLSIRSNSALVGSNVIYVFCQAADY